MTLRVKCVDGQHRRFVPQSRHPQGGYYGYVQVDKVSVSGRAKRRGRGWRFIVNPEGKNSHLLIRMLPNNTTVIVTDPAIPAYLRSYRARVTGVDSYQDDTPLYNVTFNHSGRPKRVVPAAYLEALTA